MTLARLDSQREGSDLYRSWSNENLSNVSKKKFFFNKKNYLLLLRCQDDPSARHQQFGNGPSTSGAQHASQPRRDSPPKRMQKQAHAKQKPMSPDEWLKKLEANDVAAAETEELNRTGGSVRRSGGKAQQQKANAANGLRREQQQSAGEAGGTGVG